MAPPVYRITRVPRVNRQIQDLAQAPEWKHAKSLLATALQDILQRLRFDPIGFGERVFPTKKPGGAVYTAAVKPVSVTYAAFPKEKLVILLDVFAMSPPPKE